MQPQRDVGWLYRLVHHAHQLIAEPVQVGLITQLGREGFQGLSRIVLAAVEAPVYERLDAAPEGMNSAAITRVETTTASWDCSSWPVSAPKIAWVVATPPK
jgi:hypothetical protein